MEISLTELRSKIFQFIDDVVRTGKPLRIRRRGAFVKISVEGAAQARTSKMKKRPGLLVKPEQLLETEGTWEKEWKNDFP